MRKRIFTYLIVLFCSADVLGQADNDFEKKMEMGMKTRNFSWFNRHVFCDLKVTPGTEFFAFPKRTYLLATTPNPNGTNYTLQEFTWGGMMINFGGVTLEPRVNLKNFQRSSISLKVPVTLGLSTVVGKDFFLYRDGNGAFNLTVPVLLSFNRGLNATSRDVSPNGFSVSAGLQYLRAPMMGGDKLTFGYNPKYGDTFEINRDWTMPVVQIDWYRLTKKNRIRGFSLTTAVYNYFYLKFAMNFEGLRK